MKLSTLAAVASIVLGTWASPTFADSTAARCEIYPGGSDKLEKTVPCTFGQRQGHITITREDGVTHDLSPVGDAPGNSRDQDGRPVYRQSGLGSEGQVFRFPDISIFLYWNTSPRQLEGAENPTAPFATRYAGGEFDATTVLRCKASGDANYGNCPAGILRMEDNQASIVVRGPLGKPFPLEKLEGKDVLVVATGIGIAALRSLLLYIVENRANVEEGRGWATQGIFQWLPTAVLHSYDGCDGEH